MVDALRGQTAGSLSALIITVALAMKAGREGAILRRRGSDHEGQFVERVG